MTKTQTDQFNGHSNDELDALATADTSSNRDTRTKKRQRRELHRKVIQVFASLFVVALMYLLSLSACMIFHSPLEDMIEALIMMFIYFGLAWWARKHPFGAAWTGLGIFLFIFAVFVLIDVHTALRTSNLLFLFLLNAVISAHQHRSLMRRYRAV